MRYLYFSLLSIFFLTGCSTEENKIIVRDDFKEFYDAYDIDGSFVVFNEKTGQYTHYNKEQYTQEFTPASTFKICNSLIGVETGVIEDENYVIPWDSIKRNEVWDKDHDLKTAYKNSTVWYYQEVARRVGRDRMKEWLDNVHYGNTDTSGGIDLFWLEGGLRISPQEQLEFMEKLHERKLPFAERTIDMVEDIMIEEKTSKYTLRSKTGWGMQDGIDVGWYVGYIETRNNVYYFANCVQIPSNEIDIPKRAEAFKESRKKIAHQILQQLEILPSEDH